MKAQDDVCNRIFATCRRILGENAWENVLSESAPHDPDAVCAHLARIDDTSYPWLGDLATLELAMEQVRCWQEAQQSDAAPCHGLELHPALQILSANVSGLCSLIAGAPLEAIQARPEIILVWPEPDSTVTCAAASDDDLLALKIVSEALPLADVARVAGVTIAAVQGLLRAAAEKGILRKPPSLLRRTPDRAAASPAMPEGIHAATGFTLQWHLTQACDLRCRHCYDRSPRQNAPLEEGLKLLEELAAFCRQRNVSGQVSFTGGNPLLHPHFMDFYRKGAALDLGLAILGNPCGPEIIDAMIDVEKPVFYQVSLEGLEEHNDYIRGKGHFARVLEFLDMLREKGVLSIVMLTLTRDNMDQVLPLARLLEGRADRFTFNRLSLMGEGAALASVDKGAYVSFLQDYIKACRAMPHVRMKDNLLNAALAMQNAPLFGGCTGHGCGAAFNFISVLGDGEAHACRKMLAPLGNVYALGLAAVYDGERAARYRQGSSACDGCGIRPVCGGCLAVAAGLGLDPLRQRDPYCFFDQAPPAGY